MTRGALPGSCRASARCGLRVASRSPTSSNRIEPPRARARRCAGPVALRRSPARRRRRAGVRRSEKSWIARAISDFAGAAFAGDQHRQIGVHHPRHQPVERLHRGRAPDQRQIVRRFVRAGARGGGARRLTSSAARRASSGRAGRTAWAGSRRRRPRRLDRRHDRVLGRDHDHRQARAFSRSWAAFPARCRRA